MSGETLLQLRSAFRADGAIAAAGLLLRSVDMAGSGPDPAGPDELLQLLRAEGAVDGQALEGLTGGSDGDEALLVATAQAVIPSGFSHPGPWLYRVIEAVDPAGLIGPVAAGTTDRPQPAVGLGDGWFYLGDRSGERGAVYTLPSAGDAEQIFDQARRQLGGAWAGARERLTSAPEALQLRTAFDAGGPEAATVALLKAVGISWPGADPNTAGELLDLLRSAGINPSVRGEQDYLISRDDDDPTGVLAELAAGDDGIEIIARENQWLWQAHVVAGPGDRPVARIIDYETGEHFGDLDLGDFLLRTIAQTVTGSRFAESEPWISRPLADVDLGRLVGTDPSEVDQLRLLHVAVGDGWLYIFRRGVGGNAPSGSVFVLHGSAADESLERARQDLGGTWIER